MRQRSASEYELSIRPSPTLTAAVPFEFSVSLLPKLSSNEVLRVSVPVTGRVWEEVEAIPDHLNLGKGKLGGTLAQVVELKSRVSRPFTLESVVSESPGTQVSPRGAAAGPLVLDVRQAVLAPGHQDSKIKLSLRIEGKAPFEVTLPIYYYGLELN